VNKKDGLIYRYIRPFYFDKESPMLYSINKKGGILLGCFLDDDYLYYNFVSFKNKIFSGVKGKSKLKSVNKFYKIPVSKKLSIIDSILINSDIVILSEYLSNILMNNHQIQMLIKENVNITETIYK
jgi:hypothetical protein